MKELHFNQAMHPHDISNYYQLALFQNKNFLCALADRRDYIYEHPSTTPAPGRSCSE